MLLSKILIYAIQIQHFTNTSVVSLLFSYTVIYQYSHILSYINYVFYNVLFSYTFTLFECIFWNLSYYIKRLFKNPFSHKNLMYGILSVHIIALNLKYFVKILMIFLIELDHNLYWSFKSWFIEIVLCIFWFWKYS